MKNEDLLQSLGRIAREQRASEPQSLAARAAGARAGADELDDLFAPMSAAVRQRLVDGALERLDVTPAPEPAPVAARTIRVARPSFMDFFRRFGLLLVPTALAAAAALFVLRPTSSRLPSYSMDAEGGLAQVRGEAEPVQGPLLLESGAPLSITLRPQKAVDQAVEARAYFRRGGQLHPWTSATAEVAPSGAVRLHGVIDVAGPAGAGEIVVIVAPAGHMPASPEGAPGALTRAVLWR